MTDRLFDVLRHAGGVSNPRVEAEVAASVQDYVMRYGAAQPTAYSGDAVGALSAAQDALVRAAAVERRLAQAHQEVGPAEALVAELTQAARSKLVLPIILVIIVLAIVIGQML